MDKHTFAICAYKESPFLEDCIKSLKIQSVKTSVIMVTSTPNVFIEKLAEKYKIPLYVNTGKSGIVEDWNFAYAKACTQYVTITHQDDLYYKEYAKRAIEGMESVERPLLYFTDYAEIRKGRTEKSNKLLKVKRMMLAPLRIRSCQNSRFVRRRILSFGCALCCPSVTFAKQNLPKVVFRPGFRSDEDWEAWERISKREGAFVYDHQCLMGHRIHEESETTIILSDDARKKEDYIMFCKFWPKWIARILAWIYSSSEKSNDL